MIVKKTLPLLFAVCSLMAETFHYAISTDHADALYQCGETAVFTVTVTDGKDGKGPKITAGTVSVTLDNFGARVIDTATIDLAKTNPFTVKGTMAVPGFLRLRLKAKGQQEKVWGVGYNPEKIVKGASVPDDFDAFWEQAIKDYDEKVKPDIKLEPVPEMTNAKRDAFLVTLTTAHQRTLYGYLSLPKDLTKGPFPLRLTVPGAGPSDSSLGGDDRSIALKMNVHFYRPVPNLPKHSPENEKLAAEEFAPWKEKYKVSRYCYAGLASANKEDYYYYDVILAVRRAFHWAAAHPSVDVKDITYNGTSQGGGFGLIMTALCSSFMRKSAVFVPAMTDVLGYLQDNRQAGWPRPIEAHPVEQRAQAASNAAYYDAANFATRIKTPIRFEVGFADTTCAPCAVYAGFNACSSPDKAIVHSIGQGHGVYREKYDELHKWLYSK